jgi:hypothetical protein
MTVEAYFTRTPETVTPMELVYGVLRVSESPTPRHQSAVLKLLLTFHAYVTERDIGRMWVAPLDVLLDEERAILRPPHADRNEGLAGFRVEPGRNTRLS